MPYPSAREGKAKTDAARYTAGSHSSATSGTSLTLDSRPSPAIRPGSGVGEVGVGYLRPHTCPYPGLPPQVGVLLRLSYAAARGEA